MEVPPYAVVLTPAGWNAMRQLLEDAERWDDIDDMQGRLTVADTVFIHSPANAMPEFEVDADAG